MDQSTIKELVFSALNNALENGYDMRNVQPIVVANDLIMYDSDLENCTIDELCRDVILWQETNNAKIV